ncbi:MAG: preprotein translocase subunit YajC [Planctomycetota bacterium]
MENLWIMAQAEQAQDQSEVSAEPVGQEGQAITAVDSNAPATGRGTTRSTPGYYQLIFIAVIFVVMFMMFREPRRKQKQQQKMVQSLKKNDKVRTIGGIIGTVVDIKGDEIVLKVDEANNTKIRVLASAIGKTLESEGL